MGVVSHHQSGEKKQAPAQFQSVRSPDARAILRTSSARGGVLPRILLFTLFSLSLSLSLQFANRARGTPLHVLSGRYFGYPPFVLVPYRNELSVLRGGRKRTN